MFVSIENVQILQFGSQPINNETKFLIVTYSIAKNIRNRLTKFGA